MEKLQYDSLYKFFVSLGVILIASPIAAIILILRNDILVLSKEEYDSLSNYSLLQIELRNKCLICLEKFSPILIALAILMIIIGIILVISGIKKWYSIQVFLDKHIESDAKIAEQKLTQMSITEVLEKADKECNETLEETNIPANTVKDPITAYLNMEDRYYEYLISNLSTAARRRIRFNRNVKVGSFNYDFIFLSQINTTDTIYEIKYWNKTISSSVIKRTLSYLVEAGENYQNETNRNYVYKLVIISNNKTIDSIRRCVNDEIYIENSVIDSQKIQIEYLDEETIKKAD